MGNVWQIAAGEPGRFYDNLFIEHDVMFMGPGDFGQFNLENYQKLVNRRLITRHRFHQLKSFTYSVQPKDIIFLRKGNKAVALGIVDENLGYSWKHIFDDVFGWDLQHTRRIIWQTNLCKELEKIQEHGHLFKGRWSAFSGVNTSRIISRIEYLFESSKNRNLKDLPDMNDEPLNDNQIRDQLFDKGLPRDSAGNVITAIDNLRRLSKWYNENARSVKRPSEYEVVAHLILPLLQALGWSPQLLAVEWNNIDLAVFDGTPTVDKNCVLVCEAKGKGQGLQEAFGQARGYALDENRPRCSKILTTNGVQMYLYEKFKNDFSDTPVGYFNVDKIRTDHVIPKGTNAIDTLIALTPAGITKKLSV